MDVGKSRHTKNVSGSKLCRCNRGIWTKCANILLSERHVADMLATLSAKLLEENAWDVCMEWFPKEKILHQWNILHDCCIKNNHHFTHERDSFLFTLDASAAFFSGKHPTPINDSERGTLLHIRRISKKRSKLMSCSRKQSICCWKASK